jgi:hypothetical protein
MINELYLESVIVYKSDLLLKRTPLYPPKKDRKKPVRGKVVELSASSRKKLAFVASNTGVVFLTLITLTYPKIYPNDGAQSKKHLRAFLQYLRRIDGEINYLWFIEFQRRGAPHYHILVDIPVNRFDKMAVSERWAAIASKSDKLHVLAGTRVESVRNGGNLAHYAVKYAMKTYQKKVPDVYSNVGRFWGHSQGVKPKSRGRNSKFTEEELQLYLMKWLKDNHSRSTKYKVLFNATEYFERSTGLKFNE